MKRILIHGVTGSGKSTLAACLSTILGIPWTSVDDLTWRPNWESVPPEEQRTIFQEICDKEEWILDTAYAAWRDIPMSKDPFILALDYPRYLSFARLLKRTALRIARQTVICGGNRETLGKAMAKDSILIWHFTSFRRKREAIRDWQRQFASERLLVFRHPRELERWLTQLEKSANVN